MAGDLSGRLPIAGTGDELDRLAVNLNAMLERIEALMHGLKEVSDNIAHDLKTPLTRHAQPLRAGACAPRRSERDYRAALEATIAESDELIRTFDALLMIARAESGQARDNMTEFDAAEIARDVGELYEPLAEEKGLALKVEAPLTAPVRGNRELVSQALANLVDNAIKYAGPEAEQGQWRRRRDRASAPTRQGDRILLSVADHGPGIPEADRGRVVERFVRLEQSRSQPGSGLGLSLASAVARLHGGELKLEDNQPGLRTVIALPRAGPASALMRRPAIRQAARNGRSRARPRLAGRMAGAAAARLAAGPRRVAEWLASIGRTASPARRFGAARRRIRRWRELLGGHRRVRAVSLGACQRRSGTAAAAL